jgi:hypothetical protein
MEMEMLTQKKQNLKREGKLYIMANPERILRGRLPCNKAQRISSIRRHPNVGNV